MILIIITIFNEGTQLARAVFNGASKLFIEFL